MGKGDKNMDTDDEGMALPGTGQTNYAMPESTHNLGEDEDFEQEGQVMAMPGTTQDIGEDDHEMENEPPMMDMDKEEDIAMPETPEGTPDWQDNMARIQAEVKRLEQQKLHHNEDLGKIEAEVKRLEQEEEAKKKRGQGPIIMDL